MTLRTRLFFLVGAVVAVTVILVTATVASAARRAFADMDARRTAALVAQIRREFVVEGGVGEVGLQQRRREGGREPDAVQRQRLVPREAEPFQVEQRG